MGPPQWAASSLGLLTRRLARRRNPDAEHGINLVKSTSYSTPVYER
jgi:hypothetical protein